MILPSRLGFLLLALLVGACALPPSYSTDVTLFGTGVTSLETANDGLYRAVGNQAEKEALRQAAQGHAALEMRNCNQLPSLGSDGEPKRCIVAVADESPPAPPEINPPEIKMRAPCAFSQGETAPEPPSAVDDAHEVQDYLRDSKSCLDIIRQYQLALSALASSTDAATAAKDNQAIGTSLNGIGTAVGSASVKAKGIATAASTGVGGVFTTLSSAALAQWQYDQFRSAVLTTDEPIQEMVQAITVWVQYGLDYLFVMTYADVRGANTLEILQPGPAAAMHFPDRVKQATIIFATADRINLIQASYMLDAVRDMGVAHRALADSVRSHDNGLTEVITAMNNFSIASSRAQTALQQLTTPVALPSP